MAGGPWEAFDLLEPTLKKIEGAGRRAVLLLGWRCGNRLRPFRQWTRLREIDATEHVHQTRSKGA